MSIDRPVAQSHPILNCGSADGAAPDSSRIFPVTVSDVTPPVLTHAIAEAAGSEQACAHACCCFPKIDCTCCFGRAEELNSTSAARADQRSVNTLSLCGEGGGNQSSGRVQRLCLACFHGTARRRRNSGWFQKSSIPGERLRRGGAAG